MRSCIICNVVHIVKVINSEHVTHLWEERNEYFVSLGNSEGMRMLVRTGHR
jgi:hypothetical protein